MKILLLILLSFAFSALTSSLSAQDLCSKKDGCGVAQNPLEAALSAPKSTRSKDTKYQGKKPPQIQKEETSKNESAIDQNSGKDLAKEEEKKKTIENPQYLIMWFFILSVLYFYLREKRKKGRK